MKIEKELKEFMKDPENRTWLKRFQEWRKEKAEARKRKMTLHGVETPTSDKHSGHSPSEMPSASKSKLIDEIRLSFWNIDMATAPKETQVLRHFAKLENELIDLTIQETAKAIKKELEDNYYIDKTSDETWWDEFWKRWI